MSNLIAIVGPPGSGKSTSIQSLDPKTTYLINTALKELPFKGSKKLYNTENKNYFEPLSAKEVIDKLKVINEKALHIKDVIVEDANYLMSFTLINKAMETGFTKFSLMAKDMLNLIQDSKKFRSDLNIYYFSHSETINDGDDIVSHKMKTSGKVIDTQIVLEGLFTVVLYTLVETKGDSTTYSFVTNNYGKIPAKSPYGMFKDLKIENSLKIVSETVREFYN